MAARNASFMEATSLSLSESGGRILHGKKQESWENAATLPRRSTAAASSISKCRADAALDYEAALKIRPEAHRDRALGPRPRQASQGQHRRRRCRYRRLWRNVWELHTSLPSEPNLCFRVDAHRSRSRYPPRGHSRPQNIERSVPVPIDNQAAGRTGMRPDREQFRRQFGTTQNTAEFVFLGSMRD